MGKKQRKTKNKPSKCNSELHHPLTSMAEPPASRASTQHPGLSRHQGFHRTPEALTSQHPGAGSRGSRDYHLVTSCLGLTWRRVPWPTYVFIHVLCVLMFYQLVYCFCYIND